MKRFYVVVMLLCITTSLYAQGYNSKGGSHKGYNTPYTQEETRPSAWSGSGIAIGRNYIATNNHVVDGATNLYVFFPATEKQYQAEVVKTDSDNDLAVIKITDNSFEGFNNIKYGFKRDIEDVGINVFVLGYPLITTMGTEIKLTTGVVSSKSGFQGNKSQYQISAPVQPGNSGGPLFNDKGELIGIVSAKHTDAENVSYGVKFSYLYDLAHDLPSINLAKASQIASLSLSEKVKTIQGSTVMILADNSRGQSSYSTRPKQSYSASHRKDREYPIHINRPQIQEKSDTDINIIGIEITERYTAVYLSWTNRKYHDGWYQIDRNTYIIDNNGNKYKLLDTDNCAISPYKTSIAYGQTKEFVLYFESTPTTTKYINIEEPGGWSFKKVAIQ